jgi:hypothetical protein
MTGHGHGFGHGLLPPGSPSGEWTPGSISDDSLLLWFKPETIDFIDTGFPILTWADSSPNGNDANQAGAPPVTALSPSMMPGRKGAYYNGDALVLENPFTITGAADITGNVSMWFVYAKESTSYHAYLLYGDSNDYIYDTSAEQIRGALNNGTRYFSPAAATSAGSGVVMVVHLFRTLGVWACWARDSADDAGGMVDITNLTYEPASRSLYVSGLGRVITQRHTSFETLVLDSVVHDADILTYLQSKYPEVWAGLPPPE